MELDMLFIFMKLHLFYLYYLYHKKWMTENIIQNDFYSKKNIKNRFFSCLGFFWFFIHKKLKKNIKKKPGATLLLGNLYCLGWRDRGMSAQNTVTILKLFIPNAHSIHFTHVADWVAPFPPSQQSPPPPLRFFHTPPSPAFSSFPHYVHGS